MKKKEFLNKHLDDDLIIQVYYTLDEDGNILLDEESIRDEFNNQLSDLVGEIE